MSELAAVSLDRGGSTPLYLQLATVLRGQIERGEWQPDQKIPSENELNRMYGVSRMTARQVLTQLVSEDLLFRVQGKGTFVARPKIATRALAYMGIREQLESKGYSTTTRVLSTEVLPADSAVAAALRVRRGTMVHEIRRLRFAKDDPISLHTSYVPRHLADGLASEDLVNKQLCQILEDSYGLRMTKVTEALESIVATGPDAKLLRVRRTMPLLLLRQDIADPSELHFEFSRILFRGDKIRLEFYYDS